MLGSNYVLFTLIKSHPLSSFLQRPSPSFHLTTTFQHILSTIGPWNLVILALILILLSLLIVGSPWTLSRQCTSRIIMQRPTIGQFQQPHTHHLRLYSLGHLYLCPLDVIISTSPRRLTASFSHPAQSSIPPLKQTACLIGNGHKMSLESTLQRIMDYPTSNAILYLSKSIKFRSNKHQTNITRPSLRSTLQSILRPTLQRSLLPKHKRWIVCPLKIDSF